MERGIHCGNVGIELAQLGLIPSVNTTTLPEDVLMFQFTEGMFSLNSSHIGEVKRRDQVNVDAFHGK